MVDWTGYLESVRDAYAQWWRVYTFTDVVGRVPTEPEQSTEPEIPFLDLGLMAQTIVRKEEPGELDRSLSGAVDEGPERPKEKIERFSVLDGLRKYAPEHVLLVGRPGSGKSTSLLRLLIEEAQAILEGVSREREKSGNGDGSLADLFQGSPIPILVELRYFQDGIEELIRNFLKQHGVLLPVAEIEPLLFEGKLLLLVDGINELPSEEARRQLRVFHQTYGKTPMVFTTRDLGVGGKLGIEKKLEMQPLSEAQMRQFVRGYLPGEGEKLLAQLQERLRSFGQTPLLLWMLCSLFRATGEVPQNLGLVFRQFTRSYESQLRSDVPVSEESRRWWPELLETLAFRMTTGESLTEIQVAIERSVAESCLAEFLESKQCDRPWDRAKEYIQDLLNHHLIQKGTGEQVEFRHQLIQEYYTAEAFLGKLNSLSNDVLQRQYLNYLKWTEPLKIVMALLSKSDDITRIMRLALETDIFLAANLTGASEGSSQQVCVQMLMEAIQAQNTHSSLTVELLHITSSNLSLPYLKEILLGDDLQLAGVAARSIAVLDLEESKQILTERLHSLRANHPNARKALPSKEVELEVNILEALGNLDLNFARKEIATLFRESNRFPIAFMHPNLARLSRKLATKKDFQDAIEELKGARDLMGRQKLQECYPGLGFSRLR